MLEFIIVEDMKVFNDKIVNIVDSFIIQNKVEAKTKVFYDYNKELEKIILDNSSFKIYILDIELSNEKGINGIHIANMIRKYDNNSLIIFITDYFNKYAQQMLESKIMFLKFISKSSDYENTLHELFKEQILNKYRKNILVIKTLNILYRFEAKELICVKTVDRKVKVVLSYTEFESSKKLQEIYDMVDNRFMYSHKSCFINIERIEHIDTKNRVIYFDNGYSTNIVSSKYLKIIINCLNHQHIEH